MNFYSRITPQAYTLKYLFSGGYLDSVEILDLDTLTWSTGAPMPMEVYYGTGHTFNGKFIVVGGYGGSGLLE